jgi:HK97 family phage major capsid protein
MSKANNLRQKAQKLTQEADAIFKRWESEDTPAEELAKMNELIEKAASHLDEAETIDKLEETKAASSVEKKEPVVNVPSLSCEKEDKALNDAGISGGFDHKAAFEKVMKYGKSGLDRKALNRIESDSGGVLVPEEFRMELIQRVRDINKLRALVDVMTIDSAALKYPTFDHTATMPYSAENATITSEDFSDSFGEIQFVPKAKKKLFPLSHELIRDAKIDISGLLLDHFAMIMAEIEEDDILNGDGVNEPNGLLNCTFTPTAQTLTAANWSTAATVLDAFEDARAELPQQYRRNAMMVVSRDTMNRLRKLRDADSRPLINYDARSGDFPTLHGMAIVECEAMAATAADGDAWCLIGDLKKYKLVERAGGLQVAVSEDSLFSLDQVQYRVKFEQDGNIVDSRAFVRIDRSS